MNPLFKNFERYVQQRALSEFERSKTAGILKEIQALSRNRTASKAKLERLTRELLQTAKGRELERLVKNSDAGKAAAQIERYAAGGWKQAALESMFQSLGPLGELFRTFLRPQRKPLTGIQREIEAAYNLLQAFRPDLVRDPGAIERANPANAPQRRPLSPGVPGRPVMTGRMTMPAEAADAKKLLETLGFSVNPPGKKASPDVEYITTQAGDRVGVRVRGKALPYAPNDPILTGEMIRVNSSNVHSIGFIYDHENPSQSVLKVRFLQTSRHANDRKVAGPMYFYYRVAPEIFQSFRTASSKGTFVWDRLRIRGTVAGHQYQYDLKGIAEEHVPRKAARFGPNEYYISRRVKVQSMQGHAMGYRESKLPDQLVGKYEPTRGRRPTRPGSGRRLGPSGPRSGGR